MATTTKPKRAPSFPHWLVLSPITSAVKMMISVEGAEKWKVLEHARYVVMLIVWLALWIIRLLLVNFPTLLPPSGILESIATTTSPSQDNITCQTPCSPPSCSIGRALSQVLGLVNDTPVTSRKYEFVRNLADKMIEENWKYGCPALEEVTRMALSAGFGRTLKMLDSCLRQQQQDEATSGWGWKLIRRIPLKGIPLYSRVENIGGGLSNLLQMQMQPPPAPAGSLTLLGSQPPVAPVGTETMMAEKLAKELMWIADKLAMCSAVEVAILQWSSASSLANLSISANPRVQGSLVRVSVFLFTELARLGEEAMEGQVRAKMLVLWLPVFSYAMNGVDSPVLSAMEKAEMERVLEKTIESLSEIDQELVLANWLHQYTSSSSDWPNLQKCYHGWCHASRRKL